MSDISLAFTGVAFCVLGLSTDSLLFRFLFILCASVCGIIIYSNGNVTT